MTVIVQTLYGSWHGPGGFSENYPSTPTQGNLLVCVLFQDSGATISSTGWALLETATTTSNDAVGFTVWSKTAGASESTTVTTGGNGGVNYRRMVLYELAGTYDASDHLDDQPNSSPLVASTITPTDNPGFLLVVFSGQVATYAGDPTWTPQGALVTDSFSRHPADRPVTWTGHIDTSGGAYSPSLTTTALYAGRNTCSVVVSVSPGGGTIADFTADVTYGSPPLTVNFTDLSTNSPTSWAWDFGDDNTSTSQNPSHVYADAGFYTVSLTATNTDGSDTEIKTAYVHVVNTSSLPPQSPAKALVEIYTDEAGAYRWDDATWDDAIWATSAWQDITPESVDVVIRWGSSRPELGILAQPDAESWALDIYDPDRSLDPANVDGPYYGSLKPGLPIRINHGTNPLQGFTIRTGIVESMGHDFTAPGTGYIRVTNDQSTYANAAVPHDTTLSDTLFARARDAIAAAGLPVRVLADPSTGDPDLVAWADTGSDQTVWDWIADAAQSVLWIPYFDRNGWLGFRKYGTGYSRALQLAAPEMVNLLSVSQYNGNYSRIQVHDSADVEVVRHAATDYGKRTFTRTNLTPDAAAWAEAVLADRAFDSLWWQPGTVHPFTGDRVKLHAATTAVEVVDISHTYTDPAIDVSVIVLGGEIRITAMADDEAIWEFVYHTSQSVPTPLAVTGTTNPVEYLIRTGGGDAEYLFPSL